MSVKTRKTIKYVAVALLCALFALSLILLGLNAFKKRTSPFADKLVLNLRGDSPSAEGEKSSTSVTLQYADTFTCTHGEIETEEELEKHRAELRAYYEKRNAEIVKRLDLSDSVSCTYSNYGPFIEYSYDSADDFLSGDVKRVEAADCSSLERVYVEDKVAENLADRKPSAGSYYSLYTALSHVGLLVKAYQGRDIKIGILEQGIPSNLVNLEGITYETYGTYQDAHAFWTSSILGGTNGIATKASLYFAALENVKYLDSANWFIEKGVNVINCSYGWVYGMYTAESAIADYLVTNLKMTYVASAGNEGDVGTIRSPSTGVNVICVASNDVDLAVSNFSSAGMATGQTISLAKPTLTAPGGYLTGIPNISGSLYGTSFSAPIVTGIVALLMNQFPQLKLHPEMVMAALTNSCTPAKGQTETWDHDAGFGIVNYKRAVKYCEEEFLHSFSTPASTAKAGASYYNTYVEIPLGATLSATSSTLVNCTHFKYAYPLDPVEYSDLVLAVSDFKTNEVLAYGETISNVSYIDFKNETYLSGNPTTEFVLSVFLRSDKNFTKSESGAIDYYVEAAEPYGVVVSSGEAVENGGTACLDFFFVAIAEEESIGQCYIKTPSSGSWQTYRPYTVIPASSVNGKYEFKFSYFLNDTSYTFETAVYLDSASPTLAVETQVYGSLPKNGAITKVNCNDYTQYFTSFKIIRIDGDASAKVDVTKDGKTETYTKENLPEFNGGEYVVRVYDDIGNSYSFNMFVVSTVPAISFTTSDNDTVLHVIVSFEQSFITASDFTVYRDGAMVWHYVPYPDYIHYTYKIDGEYRVVVVDNIGRTTEKTYTFAKPKPACVLSVADGASTNAAVSFTYGDDFSVDVLKDGQQFPFDGTGEIHFTDDGKYNVKIYYNIDDKSYSVYNFEIDTQPPTYNISGVDESGISTSPVVISGLEDGVVLQVFRNGVQINYAAGDEISASGEYEIILTDAAGNTSTCSFVIENTTPTQEQDTDGDTPVWVIIFVAASVVTVGGITALAVIISRKRRRR